MKKEINGFKKNDSFTAEITDITNLGQGVCHLDGVACFVNNTVDGDVIEGKIIKIASGYLVGRCEKLIKPSEYRIEDDKCGVYRQCGGCTFRLISFDHELEIKKRYVESVFRKAGIDAEVMNTLSGMEDGWRNKVQIPVSEGYKLGYYSNHSHDVVQFDYCPLHTDNINSLISVIAGYLKKNPISSLRHLCIREGKEGLLCCFVVKHDSKEIRAAGEYIRSNGNGVCGVLLNINSDDTNVIYGKKFITLYGNDYITDNIDNLTFRISMPSFYQVNKYGAELAYGKLLELSDLAGGETVLDLYCGTGTIGQYFAAKSGISKLYGIEIEESSVENAKRNAVENGIINVEYLCDDAENGDISSYNADLIIVDPPRKGLSDKTVENIIKALPEKIAYMSCNPDTLARDCKKILAAGYTLSPVFPINMFPRCGHVETVCLLTHKI